MRVNVRIDTLLNPVQEENGDDLGRDDSSPAPPPPSVASLDKNDEKEFLKALLERDKDVGKAKKRLVVNHSFI